MRFDRSIVPLVLLILGLCGGSLPLWGQDPAPAEPSTEVEPPPVHEELKRIAEQVALPELSGDHPFILRESNWSGQVEPGKARLIQVQLFKRNEYSFWFVVPDRKAGLNLSLYNGKGELVEGTNRKYETPNIVSLMTSAGETGIYYLRISMQTTAERPQPWTVIYAYR